MNQGLLLPGYRLRSGTERDRALLVSFMERTYREFYPEANLSHLPQTIDQYWSEATPLWFVEADRAPNSPLACLWLGTAVDQLSGDRHTHLFLIYVVPDQRRRGMGTALIRHAESWAAQRGDPQVGLQVFEANQTALRFYQSLGYQTQALWMVKPLSARPS